MSNIGETSVRGGGRIMRSKHRARRVPVRSEEERNQVLTEINEFLTAVGGGDAARGEQILADTYRAADGIGPAHNITETIRTVFLSGFFPAAHYPILAHVTPPVWAESKIGVKNGGLPPFYWFSFCGVNLRPPEKRKRK